MIGLLILWGLVGFSLSKDVGEINIDTAEVKKPGECPEDIWDHKSASILPPCPDPCMDKDNCTTQSCVDDSQCPGSFKCCKARCGMECLPPKFRSPCRGDFDCPWSLKCCDGICDSDCAYQPQRKYATTKEVPSPRKKAN
ncbi:waprin-Phi3-like isoform X1 [Spea bombifrons]|uniref:waprin-Phi3-like isoform X1 n=1 Tax=Spea bombifrons TaxID=233779 RepID=UPI00234BBE75|nr:waprin-Phi3-like isoform X1 [Spea bombifrons]